MHIWTQDDAIRDFFKRTKALQDSPDPLEAAKLEFSGAVIDCTSLLALGWEETDEEGAFSYIPPSGDKPAPAKPGKGKKKSTLLPDPDDAEAERILAAASTGRAVCRFARAGNFLCYTAAPAASGRGKTAKRDLRRLLDFEFMAPIMAKEEAALRILEEILAILRQAVVLPPLGLDAMLSLSEERLEYKGRAELSAHDLPFGSLYNCILHSTEPGSDFRDGEPSFYRRASTRCALAPLVRALSGRGTNAERANVMAFDDAGLFCQLAGLASGNDYHYGARILAAAIFLKRWDSIDTSLEPSDFATLGDAFYHSGDAIAAALCYSKTLSSSREIFGNAEEAPIRLGRAIDAFLKDGLAPETLPAAHYLKGLFAKIDRNTASATPFVVQSLLIDGAIASLEPAPSHALSKVAARAFQAVREFGESMRPKSNPASTFEAHVGVGSQLLWDVWTALESGPEALSDAIAAFPVPRLAYGENLSSVVARTFIHGASNRDVWRGLSAFPGGGFPDGVFDRLAAGLKEELLDECETKPAFADQTSLFYTRLITTGRENTPRRADLSVFYVIQVVAAKPSPGGRFPLPRNIPARMELPMFPWPDPKCRENRANVEKAQVWQWYPWRGSSIADVRFSLGEADIYASFPPYHATRDEILRGAECDFFVFAIARGMIVHPEGSPCETPPFAHEEREVVRSAFSAGGKVLGVKAVTVSPAVAAYLAGSEGRIWRVSVEIDGFPVPIPVFVNSANIQGPVSELKLGARVAMSAIMMADLRKVRDTPEIYAEKYGPGLFTISEQGGDDFIDEPQGIHLVDCHLDDIPSDPATTDAIASLAEGDTLEMRSQRRTGPGLPPDGEDAIGLYAGEIRVGAVPKPHDAILLSLMAAGKELSAAILRITINRGTVGIECAIHMLED